ncbi:MAG: tyrosine-type recombinase/integrase [Betaproteobacteria bacterium]|nr:tyrosine-type recombinase/integrase [Betaproteobacteria bacterium]
MAANRTLADVKHLFSYSYEKGWVRENPTSRITRKVVGGKEKSRAVVLTEDQLKHLIKELRTDRWQPRTRVALAVCLLTGQRASEVLGISKDEVQGNWWTIPAERTKPKRAQKVYLSRPVRYLLGLVDYTRGDHRTLSRALNRGKLSYTPHDLRRTMATVMAENLSVAPHVS